MMRLFVRITAIVAVAIVALVLLGTLIKIVFWAALIAALIVGCLAVYNQLRRRAPAPIAPRYTWRR
jgi:uncharacterized membrane protein YjjB (DUF3815 family)